jgi:hypothetical protein
MHAETSIEKLCLLDLHQARSVSQLLLLCSEAV